MDVLDRMPTGLDGIQAAGHVKKANELTTVRLQETQCCPIGALESIRTLAKARQTEIDAVTNSNIAKQRLLAAMGKPT